MRMLVVSQYFAPESFVINDLVRVLRDQGHHVVVVTGKPNYPDGRIFDGYSASGVQFEMFDGNIELIRLPLRPRHSGGPRNLVMNYLSFVVSGLFCLPALLRGRTFDVIFVFGVSPITQAIPAILLKWRTKAHLAIWVQDLWPESLSATGYVRNRLALAMVGAMVRWIYSQADTLLAQSESFIAPISRYARREKIVYFPTALKDPSEDEANATDVPANVRHLLESKFCAVFAGNIGSAQAVDALISASVQLRDLQNVRVVLVGSGSMLEWVEKQKRQHELDNLVLAGRFPSHVMPAIYARAACLLVSLKNEEIFSYTLPAKVSSYLAAGRPIVAAINGEAARVIRAAGAGFTCEAEDGEALARNIRKMYLAPAEVRESMGSAGRSYYLAHFEARSQAERMMQTLNARITQSQERR